MPVILVILLLIVLVGLAWLVFEGFRLLKTMREWISLIRGGAKSVTLVSAEPPKGFLLNRDAKVTLAIEGKDGSRKEVDRSIPIPMPQAFLWRVAGRVPLPIGRLTDKREINRRIWKSRKRDAESVS